MAGVVLVARAIPLIVLGVLATTFLINGVHVLYNKQNSKENAEEDP